MGGFAPEATPSPSSDDDAYGDDDDASQDNDDRDANSIDEMST